MNFDNALNAHVSWKTRLSTYLRNPDKSLNANEVVRDNQCELGKWLESEQGKYGTEPAFQELKREYTRFHSVAADVARRADSGKPVTQELVMGASSPYAQCSQKVIEAIIRVRKIAG